MHISKCLVRKDCEHLLYVRVIICSWRCRVFIMRRAFKHRRWNFAAAVTSIPPTHHTEKTLKRRFDKLCSNRSTRTWNDSHHHYHHDSQEPLPKLAKELNFKLTCLKPMFLELQLFCRVWNWNRWNWDLGGRKMGGTESEIFLELKVWKGDWRSCVARVRKGELKDLLHELKLN